MSDAYTAYLEQDMLFGDAGLLVSTAVVECMINAQRPSDDESAGDFLVPFSVGRSSKVGNFLHRILIAEAVDNFNCFLGSLVFEILEIDPRPIAGKNVPIRDILQATDLDELKKSLVEKFVVDLGYQSIEDLSEMMERNFGIKSLSHWLTKRRLNRYNQIRNVISHRRGIVDKTYLRRSKSKVDVEGQYVKVQHPARPSNYLLTLAGKIDGEATSKFSLSPSVWPIDEDRFADD